MTKVIITTDNVKAKFSATTHIVTNFNFLPLRSNFKSQFPHMNRPRITDDYFTCNFFSSDKGIGGPCYAKVFYVKKHLFGDVYGTETDIQGGINSEPSLVIMINQPASDLIITRRNAENNPPRYWANSTYTKIQLNHIIRNITQMNT